MKILTRLALAFYVLFMPLFAMAQLSSDVDALYIAVRDMDVNADLGPAQKATQVNFDNGLAQLSGIATDQELVYIAQTGSSSLKQYAIGALIERKSAVLIPLFSDFIASNSPLTVRRGDKTLDSNSAIEMYYGVAQQKERLARKQYYERTVSKTELGELRALFGRDFDTDWTEKQADSLSSVFTRIALDNDNVEAQTLGEIFKINEYTSGDYERVRFFAHKFPTPEILATLASFRNTDDVSFIIANFDCAISAVAQHPHPDFFPELQSRLVTDYDQPEFQAAVSSYKSAKAAKVLAAIHSNIASKYRDRDAREQKLLELYNVVEKYQCAAFDPILLKLQQY